MSLFRRVNTLKVDLSSLPKKPTAVEIHEWLVNVLKLNADQVDTIQLNKADRAVYVKVCSQNLYNKILLDYQVPIDFQLSSGEIFPVFVRPSDTQFITVRIFNLPPEIPNSTLQNVLSQYGTVQEIRNEKWSSQYMLPVNNGIRAVKIDMKKNIPALLTVATYTVTVNYPGQILTCFKCGETNHLKQDCPQQSTVLTRNPHNRLRLMSEVVRQQSNTKQSSQPSKLVIISNEQIEETDVINTSEGKYSEEQREELNGQQQQSKNINMETDEEEEEEEDVQEKENQQENKSMTICEHDTSVPETGMANSQSNNQTEKEANEKNESTGKNANGKVEPITKKFKSSTSNDSKNESACNTITINNRDPRLNKNKTRGLDSTDIDEEERSDAPINAKEKEKLLHNIDDTPEEIVEHKQKQKTQTTNTAKPRNHPYRKEKQKPNDDSKLGFPPLK